MKTFLPNVNSVGLLITKNEESIIEEVISKNEIHFDSIYALDGSNDSTPNILSKFKKIKHLVLEKDLGINKTKDGVREVLLQEIRKNESLENTWVTLMHSDEIFYHSPRKVAQYAEIEGSDWCRWFAMHFFVHSSYKNNWNDLKSLPVEDRINHYATNELPWIEFRQFKLKKDSRYFLDHHHIMPTGISKCFSRIPIYKQYVSYDTDEHTRISLNRTSKRPGNIEEKFIDYLDDACGNYKFVHKFEGSFGPFEFGNEILK
jgi:hypothetical protein